MAQGSAISRDPQVRVLVADDDSDVRFLMTHWLRSAQVFDVVAVAADGREALEAAGRLRPELVILDLAMPGMDGLEAAAGIRQVLPHSRIVVQSGFSAERMAQRAIDAGADVYLEKSGGPGPLLAALDGLFDVAAPGPSDLVPDHRGAGRHRSPLSREDLLLDALDVGVAYCDAHGRITAANFAATLVLGVPTSGIVGWHLAAQLAGAHPDRARDASEPGPDRGDPLSLALASGRPQSGSVLGVVRPDCTVGWVRVNVRPLFDEPGDGAPSGPSGAVVVLQDVTEERELRAAAARRGPVLAAAPTRADRPDGPDESLPEATELLEAALASSPVGAALFDGAGRLVIANPEADRLLGGSPLLGTGPVTRPVRRADTGEPVAPEELPGHRACGGEHVDDMELLVSDTQGAGTYVRVSSRPIFGGDGRLAGAVVSALDVTAAKHAEQALAATHAELERSNAELENFASIASHDLSQPLQMVYGFAQLLREGGAHDEHAGEHIDRILAGCERMRTLIRDLLAYSRVTTEARSFEPVDLAAVAAEVVEGLRPVLDETQAQVTVDALPTVRADRTQMTQLFQNLLGNAVTYVAPQVTPRVHVHATRRGREWLVVVADNGIGIRPQDREKAFGMFQRLVSSSTFPGTGIGLAVCARIVERHGGRIWVEDNLGGGSRFCLTLPDPPP